MHKCSRDDCPPNVIKGPKIKCSKCNNECFMKCFGLEKAEKIEGNETIKIALPNGAAAFVYLTQVAFVCCSDGVAAPEQKNFMPKMIKQRATSRSRQPNETTDKITSDISMIKTMLSSIRNATDKNAADLLDIKGNTNEIIDSIKTQNKPNIDENRMKPPTPSFTDILRINAPTPKSSKRLRRQVSENQADKSTQKLPTPKKGTRDITIGKQIVLRQPKPIFDKAIWVSGLHSETTVDEINDFLLSNTEIIDNSQFQCHKLVKKDADLTKLSFVSFKISTNNELFEHLMDPSIWPKSISVREFKLKPVFGDFLPAQGTPYQRESQREKKQRLTEKNEQQTPTTSENAA